MCDEDALCVSLLVILYAAFECMNEIFEFYLAINTVLCMQPLSRWPVGGQMDAPFGQSICRSHDGP